MGGSASAPLDGVAVRYAESATSIMFDGYAGELCANVPAQGRRRRRSFRTTCNQSAEPRFAKVAFVSVAVLQVPERAPCVDLARPFSFANFEIELQQQHRTRARSPCEVQACLPAGMSFAVLVSSFTPESFTVYVPTSSSNVGLMISRVIPLVRFVT